MAFSARDSRGILWRPQNPWKALEKVRPHHRGSLEVQRLTCVGCFHYTSSLTCSQSCLTLCNPLGCSQSVCPWNSPARILEWVAISYSRGSSWPRDGTCVSCIGRPILYHWARWEALHWTVKICYFLEYLQPSSASTWPFRDMSIGISSLHWITWANTRINSSEHYSFKFLNMYFQVVPGFSNV